MSENPLSDLFERATIPPEVKRRVIGTLRTFGLIEPRVRVMWRLAIAAGLLLAALGIGFALGRTGGAPTDDEPRYLLLLYEDSTYRDDRPILEIVAEYADWADSLRRARVLESGEKLADARFDVSPALMTAPRDSTTEGKPTGFFVVRAVDAESAKAIARSSPHLRYGGRIGIRPIE